MLRGGCAHGRSSSRPGCGAKWAPQNTLCTFDGGAHGASAHLSAPIRVNPAHPERRMPSHTQPRAMGATRSLYVAARAIFVPEFESAGSPFCASGAKSVVVPHSVSSDLSQPALGNNHLSSLDLGCKQPRLHDLCCKQPRSPTPRQNCRSAHGLRFFYDSERSPR